MARSRADSSPTRVTIIGGGCAAMTAAFELTRPEHQGRFAVTVYQQGWRLGGKGASGRGPAGRIEEHGLHLWMGWYENAFRILRECYTELTGDPDAWRAAFTPASLVSVTDHTPDGRWIPWMRAFPAVPGMPGDPPTAQERWTVRDYVSRTLALLRTLFEGVRLRVGEPPSQEGDRKGAAKNPFGALDRLVAYGELATLAGIVQGIAFLETALASRPESGGTTALRFLDALAANARRLLTARLEDDSELRSVWYVIDLALATLRGYVTANLLTDPRGFDAIDDVDCREWLRHNGASEEALDSGYLRGLYDLGFAYEDGDPAKPRVSAAQAVRGFVRAFFTYRGAFFWKMQGGMGDVVFAPLYEVLRRRGVRFRFFHRLTNVGLGRGTPHVAALRFDVQARVTRGEYAPLVDVRGMRCWPSAPLLGQLRDGARIAREGWDFESHWDRRHAGTTTLRVGRDFDFVVLGVGIGAVPHVCREILAKDQRWRDMVRHVKTVATQAFQLWLDADLRRLGWPHGSVTLSGFVEPFDTWADMHHLLRHEAWPRTPRGIAYFCNVLPDAPGTPDEQHARVRENAIRFLDHEVAHLWPKARRATGGFAWELLATPPGWKSASGAARFASQYWTANVNPSDRYTLALPGTARHRISPLDATYDNLTVCGDWTDSGFNSGCVEAAVMSGRLAAHALSRSPSLADIVGFDHP
jgi:uncharacterized protein with NAD-binding domain and iron-sulfur cluster